MPYTRPMFRVSGVTGAITGPGGRGLECVVIDQAGYEMDKCIIDIDDRNAEIQPPTVGTMITVEMGYEDGPMGVMGQYYIEEVILSGWPRFLEITGTGLNILGKAKETRAQDHHNSSVLGVLEENAKHAGLTLRADPALAEKELKYWGQQESDMMNWTRLGENYGLTIKTIGNQLIAVPKGAGTAASGGSVTTAVAEFPRNVKKYEVRYIGRNVYGDAIGSYVKMENAEPVQEVVKKGVSAAAAVLGSGDASYKLPPMWNDGQRQALDATTAGSLKMAADSAELEIVIIGEPSVFAETPLEVKGVRADVDGTWYITRVQHTINNAGYETHIKADLGQGAGAGSSYVPST